MQTVAVLAAAVGAYAFGAVWYMMLSRAWVEAAGVKVGRDGRPANAHNPLPYVVGFVSAILVAGMMRHVFALSGIDSPGAGLVAGLGAGLFLALPWLATCYSFAGRPLRLLLIDGGYVVIGSAIIGTVLGLF